MNQLDRKNLRFTSIFFSILSILILILFLTSDKINEKTAFKSIAGSMIYYEYSETKNDNETSHNVHIYIENDRNTMYITPAIITEAFLRSEFENDVQTGDTITIWLPVKNNKRNNKFIYSIESKGKKYLDIERAIELSKKNDLMGIFVIIGFFFVSGFLFIYDRKIGLIKEK